MKENDIDILARTIYGEARGETDLGKMAVASVILNRYKAKKWFSGSTIAETCQFCVKGSKFHQFSCWNESDPNFKKLISVTNEDAQFSKCLEIAKKYISGELKDVVCGACHYHTVNVLPKWAKNKKADFLIGNHLFYCGIL